MFEQYAIGVFSQVPQMLRPFEGVVTDWRGYLLGHTINAKGWAEMLSPFSFSSWFGETYGYNFSAVKAQQASK